MAAAPVAWADDPPPGEYTYEEALALGIVHPEEHARPPGMPTCPPIQNPFPSVDPNEEIPANAPSCWVPPEDQELVFIVLPPGDPGYPMADEGSYGVGYPPAPDQFALWPIEPLGIALDKLFAAA